MMKRVAYHNLGCKVNSYEMDVMLQELQADGYELVPFEEQADVYIVNTCSVTNIADRKSRQMLHKAKKTNPQGIVVAVGCYVQTGTDQVREDDAVDLLVGNNRKKDLVRILREYMDGTGEDNVIDINHTNEYEEMQLKKTAEHTRAYIKIQDGCNQFCSYCIIPYARGRVRSRQEEDIIREITGLVQAGYQEFVLTGIHISSYGVDFEKGAVMGPALLQLLRKVDEIPGVKRIRIGSLEPRVITEEFVQGMSELKHLCAHFHLSLQSGCDETLRRMNRHYDTERFYHGVELLRQAFTEPAITTDVIVGFPGETEEEFEITRAFLEKICFYEMHVFKYSKRKGTRAAVMENQVPEQIKSVRSDVLLKMEAIQSESYRKRLLHQQVEVLMEESKEINGTIYQIGHTREYVKVAVRTEEDLSNKFITGTVTGMLSEEILLLDSNLNFANN